MNDLGAGANVTTKKYNNLAEADPDEFAPKTHAELEQRIALLENVAEAARALYCAPVYCEPMFFKEMEKKLIAAGYLEEGG